jgi:2,4-dienoyl-CoA reductase-like NADH-dependent reductase (Old Yellow Enzyme family)
MDRSPIFPTSAGSPSIAPLLEPFTVRGLTVGNRFIMAPMTRGGSPGGTPGANVVDYYRRRAEGGVGLIITEGSGIDHPASLSYNDYNGHDIPFLFGEPALAGWQRVTAAVHAAGGRIASQLWHQGVMRLAGTLPFPDHPSSRPSGIWGPAGGKATIAASAVEQLLPETEPLSESEIGDIIAGYARSAAFAEAAGFDAIALHGAHGYLIDSFLWGYTNRRTDRFGGDHAGRTRFAVEVIRAVRASLKGDLPIIFRFSQWKQQDFDATLAETPAELERVLVPLAEAGVDVFDASTRNFDVAAFPGSDRNLAGWARTVTGRPSITVGGVGLSTDIYTSRTEGSQAASLDPLIRRFEAGEFDLVGVGRALIAQPDWVRKVRDGESWKGFDGSMLMSLY